MIHLQDIHKSYRTHYGRKQVLKGINLVVPPDVSVGILGRNGAGKSTLLQILSGLDLPDKGRIDRGGMRLSWPIGRGGIQSSLTGIDNIRFVCRVYGMDIPSTVAFVEEFSELGEYLGMPVNTYSSGMRSRLAFAISMAAEYDCYLVDEGFNAGDARFTKRMSALFDERRQRANMIVVSHSTAVIQRFCQHAAILEDGRLTMYESVNDAIEVYTNL